MLMESRIMRRQGPCSKCGIECTSPWGSMLCPKPFMCKACIKSMEKKAAEDNPPQEQVDVDATKSSTQLSAGNSSPEITKPTKVRGGQREPTRAKSKVGKIADSHSSVGVQDRICRGSSSEVLPPRVLENIKRENDNEDMSAKEEKQTIWDPSRVQKRRRSKLPQYTLSPVQRLLNQLYEASHYPNPKPRSRVTDRRRSMPTYEKPKYDDFFIYEKFKAIPHNEIGLGAKLLPPQVSSTGHLCGSMKAIKQEPYTGDDDPPCLYNVPIRSSRSE